MGPLISQRNNVVKELPIPSRNRFAFNGAADFSAEQLSWLTRLQWQLVSFNGAADFSAEQRDGGEHKRRGRRPFNGAADFSAEQRRQIVHYRP